MTKKIFTDEDGKKYKGIAVAPQADGYIWLLQPVVEDKRDKTSMNPDAQIKGIIERIYNTGGYFGIGTQIRDLDLKENTESIKQLVADYIQSIELPKLQDLDNPVQQSWKLGGVDEISYRHGYHHACSEIQAKLDEVVGKLRK